MITFVTDPETRMTATDAGRRSIPLALIDVEDRLRPADPAFVEIVAASFNDVGQLEPVELRPNPKEAGRFLLTLGLHRLKAAELLGWAEIDAEIRERDAYEARLAEIDENLMRRELGALDRAIFLAERKRVWEAMYPQTTKGGDQKTKKDQRSEQNDILSFSSDVAEKTGLTKRTIQRSVALVANLSPSVIARIRGTYLETHGADLAALAEMDAAEQASAAARLAGGEIRRLADIRPKDRLPADEAQLKALQDAWSRASEKARRRFMKELGYAPAPRGLRVVKDEDAA